MSLFFGKSGFFRRPAQSPGGTNGDAFGTLETVAVRHNATVFVIYDGQTDGTGLFAGPALAAFFRVNQELMLPAADGALHRAHRTERTPGSGSSGSGRDKRDARRRFRDGRDHSAPQERGISRRRRPHMGGSAARSGW